MSAWAVMGRFCRAYPVVCRDCGFTTLWVSDRPTRTITRVACPACLARAEALANPPTPQPAGERAEG